MIRSNIHLIISTIDDHDAGILDGVYICPCGMRGTEQQWELHIADLVDEALSVQIELPETA
jgi:hypothetical protein